MTNRFRISLTVERMLIFAVLAAVTLSLWSLRPQHTFQPEDIDQLDGQSVKATLPCTLTVKDGADQVLYNDSLSSADTSKSLTPRGAVYHLRRKPAPGRTGQEQASN